MKKILMGTAAAVAMIAAAPAWADCAAELREYNETVSADENFRASVTPQMRADIRELRDAAHTLQGAGQEEACQEVVAAIKDMVENPRETAEQAPAYEDWNTAEIDRLKQAKSLDDLTGSMRAEEIIGSDIRNMQNEDLGEIDDILLATKKDGASYAIISYGGFFGIGDKQIAVPMNKLKVTSDRDVFVLNASEKQLENAPSFERGKFDEVADDAWREDNQTYFESLTE